MTGGHSSELLRAVQRRGFERAELYRKQGRSRRLEVGVEGRDVLTTEESGWAVRAGDDRQSIFAAGTGRPELDGAMPEPEVPGLQLPGPQRSIPTSAGGALENESLVSEPQGFGLIDEIARQLEQESPGAWLVRARLEDGASRARLENSLGLHCESRHRLAVLRLRATEGRDGAREIDLVAAAESCRGFEPKALARRLTDLLLVDRGEPPEAREVAGPMLLAPPVAARIVAGLVPALVGREAWRYLRALQDAEGRVGSAALTLVDDGRFSNGWFASPVDGEGVATREVVLVEAGVVRQPLLPWDQSEGGGRTSGCRSRFSWREPPRLGPTHLYLKPEPTLTPAGLLRDFERGHYWLSCGESRFDLERGTFELAVAGFEIDGGRARRPVARARLSGGIDTLLAGLDRPADDLRFEPLGAAIGSPTCRVEGLTLTPLDDARGQGDDGRAGGLGGSSSTSS